MPLPPKEEARFVFASVAKQSPGRVVFRKAYTAHFGCGIFRLRLSEQNNFLLPPSGEVSAKPTIGDKKYVILNEVKNPTEELTGIYRSLWSWDISLALNMTYFFLFFMRVIS